MSHIASNNTLTIIKAILFTLFFLVVTTPVFAASHYIRSGATGSASGNDWANAFVTFPNTLVRGDKYYVAKGSYSSYTFNTQNLGSLPITIKKATIAEHGTDSGWQNSYGDGQAAFGNWVVSTDYWVFDGQVRNSNWRDGATDQYGFRVTNINNSKTLRLDNGSGVGADSIIFKDIDFVGAGRDSGIGDDVVYGLAGNQDITFQNCSLRDSDRTIFLMRGCWQNLLVENSYIARNASNESVHGELLSDDCSDNLIFRNNIIEDIEGTSVWAVLNGTGITPTASNTASGWNIYGNVINWTSGYNREGVAAIFMSGNGTNENSNWVENLVFYNNTVVDYGKYVHWYGILVGRGGNNVVMNNIFYNLEGAEHIEVSCDYNWYYLSPHSGDLGAHSQTCSSNCNIFKDVANRDFTLSGNNLPQAGESSIGGAFNTDMNGVIRGMDGYWDRGAYEYMSKVGDLRMPNPPVILQIQ